MREHPTPVLLLAGVERRYRAGRSAPSTSCNGVDLALEPGESVALVAPSGAGKSTLLHIAGLLEQPDGGEVDVGGQPTARLADAERTALRRTHIGFVYQFHHLLPEFSALENVMLPQMMRGLSQGRGAAARRRAAGLSRAGEAAATTGRPSCRAASSSASPSPARSPTRRASCWPTSRPAISIPRPPTMSSTRCCSWCGRRAWRR